MRVQKIPGGRGRGGRRLEESVCEYEVKINGYVLNDSKG